MYLIGKIPNHYIVFYYGKQLTKKRKEKAATELLKFVKKEYDIHPDHLTHERAMATVNRFDKHKKFTFQGWNFKTESLSVVNKKFKLINIEK